MIELLGDIAAAFGFSASAGLNAYLTMLIVAVVARYSELIRLNSPFDGLTNGWIIGLLVILTLIEALVDKIPAIDTLNDVLQTVVRPVAGGVLFAASSQVIADINPLLALACGILISGVVHSVKTVARPVLTGMTAGAASPIESTLEDMVAVATTVVSILAPIAIIVLIALAIWLAWRVTSSRASA
jgi:hypothetical protein